MERPGLVFAIACLFVLEMNHLKWIVWNYWQCSRCGVAHKECGCRRKWMLYF